MAKNFECKGYTVITSLSRGLMAPLKAGLERLGRLSESPNAFLGRGSALGAFPDPDRVILAPGCMEDALFDAGLSEEERDYRRVFGDRVMREVQGYVRRIPAGRVRFRQDPEAAGDPQETLDRIVDAFRSLGFELGAEDRQALRGFLT
jgi:hypothetical protein